MHNSTFEELKTLAALIKKDRLVSLLKNAHGAISAIDENCTDQLTILSQYSQQHEQAGFWFPSNLSSLNNQQSDALETVIHEALANGGNEIIATCITVAAGHAGGPLASFISSRALSYAGVKNGFPSSTDAFETFEKLYDKWENLAAKITTRGDKEWFREDKGAQRDAARLSYVFLFPAVIAAATIPAYGALKNIQESIGSNEEFQKVIAYQIGNLASAISRGGVKAAEEMIDRQAHYMDAQIDLVAFQKTKGSKKESAQVRAEEYVHYLGNQISAGGELMGDEKFWLKQALELGIIVDPARILSITQTKQLSSQSTPDSELQESYVKVKAVPKGHIM